MAKDISENLQAKAEALFKDEVSAWEDAQVFITERVSFLMRNVIRQARRNYYGIFESPVDPVSGRKKTFVPLTHSLVEAVVKNIDLDTKDINLRAKKPEAMKITALARNVLKNWLDENYFGEALDMLERQLAIDGTRVWKTFEKNGRMIRKDVDLLNFYIDPAATSIQETPSVIERSLMTKSEFDSMDRWYNKENINIQDNLHPTEMRLSNVTTQSPQKFIEVFERWGLMSKAFITGKKSDEEEMIEGHLVASGNNGNYSLHFAEENIRKDSNGEVVKPYEEAWMRRVPGRWYGMGIPEQVFVLQSWMNAVVNIRINRAFISQLGIFKIKRGSSITPQMLSRLASNGTIMVDSMDDIDQFVMQEASQASYNDETNIQQWAERITSAFSTITGEQLPASTPATNAVLQNRNAMSAFTMSKEQIGMFLQRWLKRHGIPMIMKNIKKGDIARITGKFSELRTLDERIVNKLVYDKLDEMTKNKAVVSPKQVLRARESALEKLKNMGEERFVNLLEKIDFTQYDAQVFITNEEIDKAVLAQNLVASLRLAPQFQGVIIRQLFDIMGLDVSQLDEQKTPEMPQQAQGSQVPGVANPEKRSPISPPTEAKVTQQANTINV